MLKKKGLSYNFKSKIVKTYIDFLLLCDNGTPSFTEDYLPCAMMLFTMKFE